MNTQINSSYENAILLFEKFGKENDSSFNQDQKLLLREAKNKLNGLHDLSGKIRFLNDTLTSQLALSFDENTDILTIGTIKLRLNRADPKVKIKIDNVSKAFPLDYQNKMSNEDPKLEKELEKITRLYYQDAYRFLTILRSHFSHLKVFTVDPIDMVRNKLIEHPDNKPSGVFDSFVYSKHDGPMIKGVRLGNQTQDMDKGFFSNEPEFLKALINKLSTYKD